MIGSKFILFGSLAGAVLLSLFLYTISAGSAYSTALANTLESSSSDMQPIQATKIEVHVNSLEKSNHLDGADLIECKVNSSFPDSILRWCDPITHYSEKRGLDPDLVAAIIWQESGGKPQAYSSSGAVGLMQIMPSDGVSASFMCINGPCFSARPKIAELEDPEFNISYGTKMLAGLQSRTGDLREALKSYGPMNVGYYYADKVLGIYQKYGAE